MDEAMIACRRAAGMLLCLVLAVVCQVAGADAPTGLPEPLQRKIDEAARGVLESTGAPSASIAIVRDGRIVYVKAYGDAQVEPKVEAAASMPYAIGSVSKQFTASALLMLQQDGKLSLDDKVGKYLPQFARAGEVTLRQLLNHSSGYQDYWPQDYIFADMLEPVRPETIMERWAARTLDFEPGTKWQYSNTGYVIAGVIAEKVSGKPLPQLLQERIFAPLGMASARDIDREGLGEHAPVGYRRFALGPSRVAPTSAPGWLFAAGELAMTAEDLAKWNISLMDRSLLSPRSYRELATDTLLASGVAARYGLGVDVAMKGSRRVLEHGGEVSGFTADNVVYPDDRVAITVLVNLDASQATGQISGKIADLLFEHHEAVGAARLEQARRIFEGLQKGEIDRALFTGNANFYFSEDALKDFKAGLGPLGPVSEFTAGRVWQRGGMTGRMYDVVVGGRKLRAWTYEMPDGTLEQYQVAPKE
jgi:CubicO group peptidase (beta-lactamase class C family)